MAKFSKRFNSGKALISFPNVIEAKLNTMKGKEIFDCQFIFKKGSKELAALEAIAEEVINENYGEDELPDGFRMPFKDGDAVNKKRVRAGKAEYPYLKGCVLITPWCEKDNVPDMYDGQARVEDKQAAKKLFYSGAECAGLLNAYVYDNTKGAGLNFGLLGIQFMSHGERLGGGGGGPTNDLLAPAEGSGTKPAAKAGSRFAKSAPAEDDGEDFE